MNIYQMHPNHGRHIAYNTVEADANIKNGWKTVTKEEYYNGIVKKEGYQLSRDELIELYELKFGKKPAHNMKTETLKEKLGE